MAMSVGFENRKAPLSRLAAPALPEGEPFIIPSFNDVKTMVPSFFIYYNTIRAFLQSIFLYFQEIKNTQRSCNLLPNRV